MHLLLFSPGQPAIHRLLLGGQTRRRSPLAFSFPLGALPITPQLKQLLSVESSPRDSLRETRLESISLDGRASGLRLLPLDDARELVRSFLASLDALTILLPEPVPYPSRLPTFLLRPTDDLRQPGRGLAIDALRPQTTVVDARTQTGRLQCFVRNLRPALALPQELVF